MRLCAALTIAAAALSGCATDLATGFSDDARWQVVESAHFVFHYRANSTAERDISQIAAIAERDYVAITTALDVRFDAVINYYIYTPTEGNSIGSYHADPSFLAIYQTYPGCRSAGLGMHEMVHVISYNALGEPSLRLLGEGLANALDGTYGCVPFDACLYWQNDTLLSVRAMVDREDDYAEREFYPQAGSFVRFLLRRHGPAPFKQLFPVGYEAFDREFARLYGRTVEDVENEYRQELASSCGPR